MQALFGEEGFYALAEECVEFLCLADGHALGVDGLADRERQGAREEVVSVDGEQVINTGEGDGDQRHLRADGEEGCSGEEGLERAVLCAAALWEDEQGHAAAKCARASAEARK